MCVGTKGQLCVSDMKVSIYWTAHKTKFFHQVVNVCWNLVFLIQLTTHYRQQKTVNIHIQEWNRLLAIGNVIIEYMDKDSSSILMDNNELPFNHIQAAPK